MPRPIKCRRVSFNPEVIYFKPAGIPLRELDEVELSVEELEALRLKDLEGLEQEQGAIQMNISRPTFQRILASARHKTAEALLQGKAIRIGGGTYELAPRRLKCINNHEWETPQEIVEISNLINCPVCQSREYAEILSVPGKRMDREGCGVRRGRCLKSGPVQNLEGTP